MEPRIAPPEEEASTPVLLAGFPPDFSKIAADPAVPATRDCGAQNGDGHRVARRCGGIVSGRDFGRYKIGESLGRGGMGEVFQAYDTLLNRRVALKFTTFSSANSADSEGLQRFRREARAAAILTHPNLCPVHDVGQIDGIHYLTMAHLEGETLSQVIEREAPLGQVRAASVVRTVALALAYAHERGVIHRDLKPSNIMITREGEPVVIDFGIARRPEADPRITSTGTVLGTPHYMPPEQVEGDVRAMGPASDVYSLGVTLYEMLTARRPFEGSVGSVMGKILFTEAAPPSTFHDGLSPQLEAVCRKAMSKPIGERFPTMHAMAEALGDYLKHAQMA